MHRALTICVLALLTPATTAAQAPPTLTNARVEAVAATRGLAAAFRDLGSRGSDPAWIGYAAPIVEGDHQMCCWSDAAGRGDGCCAGCRLEPGTPDQSVTIVSTMRPVRLEGPSALIVLYRVERGVVGKIRTFSEDCPLDAGGRAVYWLTSVAPADSVAWLGTFLSGDEKLASSAIGAIAMHRDQAADRELERIAAPGQPERLREKAAFWMGNARGRQGFETLRHLVKGDASDGFRKRGAFALSQSKETDAVAALIDLARTDASHAVRGEALFWLAQKAGKLAAGTITDAIANDPETDVKRRAVFALTQLPKDEGVPLLIQVARTNRNPEVRKQAMFWLGQSKDPRALGFFEEILKKD